MPYNTPNIFPPVKFTHTCAVLLNWYMASQKILPIVEKLQLLSKPTFVNGRWRKPELGARRVAMVRQTMLSQNVYWPDKPLRNLGADKPLKLSRYERERETR